MNQERKLKKVLNVLLVLLIVSVLANIYLAYVYTVSPEERAVADIAVVGTVGRDYVLDCQLSQELVRTTYRFLPEGSDLKQIDSVSRYVFANVPSTWRYIADDIMDYRFEEYKSLIDKKLSPREIAEILGYCRMN